MNTSLKWILGILIIVVIIFIAFPFPSLLLIEKIFQSTCNKKELIDNYNSKEREILDLKMFVNKSLKDSCYINIELKNNKIPVFWIKSEKRSYQKWNLTFNSETTDTLLKEIGWSKSTLLELKNKLHKANCISIKSGEPSQIGFRRSGLGKYYYMIFDNPLPEYYLKSYDRGCAIELLTNKVVLMYYGGTIGPECGDGFKPIKE